MMMMESYEIVETMLSDVSLGLLSLDGLKLRRLAKQGRRQADTLQCSRSGTRLFCIPDQEYCIPLDRFQIHPCQLKLFAVKFTLFKIVVKNIHFHLQ
jgi:hypothetical protein